MEEAAAQGLPLPPLGDEFVTLVLVRHGESIWNKDNRFTAWMDVPLSTVGLSDARRAANLCRRAGIRFDVAFTSVLHRAVKTCHTILEHIGQLWIPTHSDWRLNERHDGALTGLNKKIAVVHYGKANVTMWRRSYATAPPPLSHSHPGWPGHDPKYARLGVAEHDLPCTESLDDTLARTLPCWGDAVTPALRAGKNVLVVTHGNVVRLLAKLIDGLSDSAIEDIDIPQCTPLVYTFRRGDMRLVPTSRRWAPLRGFFLGDVAAIKAGMKSVRAETDALFARDVRQLLRRNDWLGTTAGQAAQSGPLIYSWEKSLDATYSRSFKNAIHRVMSQSSFKNGTAFPLGIRPSRAARLRNLL